MTDDAPTRPAREMLAGLVAAAIALGLLLIPVVHLVSGPLGPLLGAILAGLRQKLGWRGVLLLGITEGVALALVVWAAIGTMVWLSSGGAAVPTWLREWLDPATVRVVVVGVGVWATSLGVMGAALSGAFRR